MAQPGSERVQPRTLIIAALASATAALVTARLWRNGAVLSAAMTPVIVAIVSELLHRPAEKVTQIRTTRRTEPLPEAGGAAPPPGPRPTPARPEPAGGHEVPRSVRRGPSLRIALTTGILAFAIAAAALTLPELIFGGAVGNDRNTTLFGGRSKPRKEKAPEEQQQPGEQTPPSTTPTTPETQPDEEPKTTPTTPTTPTQPSPVPPPDVPAEPQIE